MWILGLRHEGSGHKVAQVGGPGCEGCSLASECRRIGWRGQKWLLHLKNENSQRQVFSSCHKPNLRNKVILPQSKAAPLAPLSQCYIWLRAF